MNEKRFTLTVNGQSLVFADTRDNECASWEAQQITDYYSRAGRRMGRVGYGYDDGIIVSASTRTIANAVKRYYAQGN